MTSVTIGSEAGGLVALVGVIFMIPYLQLQLTGLGVIVEVASFEGIGRTPAMLVSFTLVAAFVFVSGVRAVARVSALKDFLLLLAALTIGIAVPHIYFGGLGPMFAALVHARPAHLTMPGATTNHGHGWFISTVLLTSFGFYMWPQAMGSSFTAKSGDTLRRNAVIMPLYGITLPLIFFVGFAAILVVPGLKNGDLALLTVVRKTFPAWFLGLIGGAGALTSPRKLRLLSELSIQRCVPKNSRKREAILKVLRRHLRFTAMTVLHSGSSSRLQPRTCFTVAGANSEAPDQSCQRRIPQ